MPFNLLLETPNWKLNIFPSKFNLEAKILKLTYDCLLCAHKAI